MLVSLSPTLSLTTMIKIINTSLIILTCFFCFAYTSSTKKQQEIIVYGSDGCHYCIDTKIFLNKNNISFTYYDIDLNKDKEQEMLSKLSNAKIPINSFQLPVIDKGGTIFTNGQNFIAFLKKIIE